MDWPNTYGINLGNVMWYMHIRMRIYILTFTERKNNIHILQVSLGMEKSGEDLELDFAIDIATVPFRIPNHPPPELRYGEYAPTWLGLITFYL